MIQKGQSALILGPRQTGKTTLVKKCLGDGAVTYPLQEPGLRLELERDPGLIVRQLKATPPQGPVFVDEAQKVPGVMDAVQYLIDEKIASFIITGSSARKIRKQGANLLPGRVKVLHLDPLTWCEMGWIQGSRLPGFAIDNVSGERPEYRLQGSMVFGALPGIVALGDDQERRAFLSAYAHTYVEEEIRAEALSRKIGAFSRFLELFAQESGTAPNLARLARDAGVSAPAIKEYLHILEETLVAERVDPYLKNARSRILRTSRYYFFDLGVRNALARLPLEQGLAEAQKGILFEHAVVLEVIRRIRLLGLEWAVRYWRTASGAEVDCVIDTGTEAIPLEIKASARVGPQDARGVAAFLREHPQTARHGWIVTMGEQPERLTDQVTAIPWQYL